MFLLRRATIETEQAWHKAEELQMDAQRRAANEAIARADAQRMAAENMLARASNFVSKARSHQDCFGCHAVWKSCRTVIRPILNA